MIEGAFFPAAAAFLLSSFMGVTGAWLYFPAGEWLTLLFLGVLITVKTRMLPWKDDAVLLLKKNFGVAPEDLLEMNLHTMNEVEQASLRAERFCLEHGQGAKISNHIALCVEEMAGNTITHGFARDRKHYDLSVRLLHKDSGLVLRFRDNCSAFDPVHYIPGEDKDALGLRLVRAFATDVRYTYHMNLNNVCIHISDRN